ncbi:hypothetical protein IAD21_00488 [Abditibacteriota bacterium]|nr:hypothetical protein IAD21_00488 [Abditibacteriota bacterium]
MYLNFLFVPTLLGALLLFVVGFRLAAVVRSPARLAAMLVLAGAMALPALLFVAYYGRVLDRAAWFYSFRAASYSELAASGLGLGAGLLVGLLQRRWGSAQSRVRFRLVASGVGVLCLVVLAVPYIKPVIAPIRRPLHDQWSEGVCLQSSSSTCGPCSASTLLKQFNIAVSERDLARECFSYRGGTENWYVARALRQHGVKANYLITSPEPATLPIPAMAGVQMGGVRWGGHFITILGRKGDSYIIGDPLVGRLVLTPQQLRSRYYFTGFFLVVSRAKP